MALQHRVLDNQFNINPYPYSAAPQNAPSAPMGFPMGTQMPQPLAVPMVPMGPPPPIHVTYGQPTSTSAPVVMAQQVGPHPTRVVCKFCNQQTTTRVETRAVSKTHLIALLLCCLGCWPCCILPYCMNSCMSSEHYCSNCNAYIGSYAN